MATLPAARFLGEESNTSNEQSSTTPGTAPASFLYDEPVRQHVRLPFDVYAKPYVPSALRVVNEEPASNVIVSETKHKIDYGAYICTFVCSDCLAPKLTLKHKRHAWVSSASELTEKSYLPCLEMLFRHECAAKEKENEHYAMYRISMQPITIQKLGRLWALSVPGLREDHPLIEMGDTLQIRQPWVDFGGHLCPNPNAFFGKHGSSMYWTGEGYRASVYSVSRAQEVVYLRVDGLDYLISQCPYRISPMLVNVVFPHQQRIPRGQLRALISTDDSLNRTQWGQEGSSVTPNESPFHMESVSFASNTPSTPNEWMRTTLFPTESHGKLQTGLRNIPHRALFDHAINYEQAHAVNSVCAVDYGNAPFLISGPPGTGKTKTLVEIAMQLLNTTKVAHLLICAPSEAAADTLALRLKHYLTPKQLLRLSAPKRADNRSCCNIASFKATCSTCHHSGPF